MKLNFKSIKYQKMRLRNKLVEKQKNKVNLSYKIRIKKFNVEG